MSAPPNNNLRTPQIFPKVEPPIAPIPRYTSFDFSKLVDPDGTEWCESYDVPQREARHDDEEILQAQIAYDEQLLKQREEQMLRDYKAKLFKNVLDGSIPQGKK